MLKITSRLVTVTLGIAKSLQKVQKISFLSTFLNS